MAHARDLYKTKLCTLYQRGNCPRQSCSFAHGEAELRRFPGVGGFNGRQENHRSGDLRDKLERRGSPTHRRRSPSRDGRIRQGNVSERRFSPRDRGRSSSRSPIRRRASRSYTPPRSPSHKSERRDTKRPRTDAPDAHLSDVSGDHYGGDNDNKNGEDGKAKSFAMSPSPSPRDMIQEQLRQVQADNEGLLEEKENLERTLAKKVEEASILTTQNTDLESKLANAQDEYRRWGSKMKKLVKVYMRCTRAQEEVKKMQSKVQKMAEEFLNDETRRPIIHADDSDYYNLSDGEPERPMNGIGAEITGAHHGKNYLELDGNIMGRNGLSALNVPISKEVIDESLAIAKKKRLHSVREKTLSSIRNMQQNGGNIRSTIEQELEHPSAHQNLRSTMTPVLEKSGKVDMFTPVDVGASKDRRTGSDASPSLRSSSIEKIRGRDVRLNLPPTGLAAHARDFQHETELEEETGRVGVVEIERAKLNLNMPPSKAYQNDGDFFATGLLVSQYVKYEGGNEEIDINIVDPNMDERAGTKIHRGEQEVAVVN